MEAEVACDAPPGADWRLGTSHGKNPYDLAEKVVGTHFCGGFLCSVGGGNLSDEAGGCERVSSTEMA